MILLAFLVQYCTLVATFSLNTTPIYTKNAGISTVFRPTLLSGTTAGIINETTLSSTKEHEKIKKKPIRKNKKSSRNQLVAKKNKSNNRNKQVFKKKRGRMVNLDGPLKPASDLILGSEIEGYVASVTAFGAFIKISYDIKGKNTPGYALLHKSQISNDKIDDVKNHFRIGQHLKKLRVVNIDHVNREVGVSLRPKRKSRKDISEVELHSEVEGKVASVTAYGAFIDIGCKQNVLLHVSRISQRKVNNIREFVNEGDNVKIRITEKNEKKKTMAGSMLSYEAERYLRKRERLKWAVPKVRKSEEITDLEFFEEVVREIETENTNTSK